MPQVSVITTAFNAAPFIEAAIRSVLDQRGVETEHIVVDDGSTDATVQVVRSIGDPRVRLIEAGRIGRGRALNVALGACRAEFIGVQDADDISHPDRLATERRIMLADPDLAVLGTGQILWRGEGVPQWAPMVRTGATYRSVTDKLVYYNPLSHSSVLLRRDWVSKIDGYDGKRSALFDWNLYVRLAASGGGVVKLSVPLVAKRIHPDQFFEGRRHARYAIECFRLQCQAVAALKRNPLTAATFPALLGYRLLSRSLRLPLREYLLDR